MLEGIGSKLSAMGAALSGPSKSPTPPPVHGSGSGSPKLTDVLFMAWKNPFTTKSDYARCWADLVGMAASDGFITTRLATGLYGNKWMVTARGLRYMEMRGYDTAEG